MAAAPGSSLAAQRAAGQDHEGILWNRMRAEIASQVATAKSTADQRLQESMTELKEHISAVLCKHSSELESTRGAHSKGGARR